MKSPPRNRTCQEFSNTIKSLPQISSNFWFGFLEFSSTNFFSIFNNSHTRNHLMHPYSRGLLNGTRVQPGVPWFGRSQHGKQMKLSLVDRSPSRTKWDLLSPSQTFIGSNTATKRPHSRK